MGSDCSGMAEDGSLELNSNWSRSDVEEEKGSVTPQIVASLGATLGAFSLGTVLSWPAPTQTYIQVDGEGNCSQDFPCLDKEQWSQVAGLMNVGAAVVPVLTALLFPKIGPKWTMMILVAPFVGGWLLLVISTHPWMFYLGRLLTGFAGGAFAIAAPAYSNEIAEPKIRGALGSLMQMMICLGILFVFSLGQLDWQILTGVCMLFPTLLFIWLYWMPRSPKFLIVKGDVAAARRSLQFFRKKHNVDRELKQIQLEQEEIEEIGEVSLCQLLSEGVYLKPLLLSMILMVLQQFSGINFVLSYTLQIFKDAGSQLDENLCSVLIGVVQVIGTAVAIFIVDRLGRKVLLAASAASMCLALLMLGIYFFIKQEAEAEAGGQLSNLDNNMTVAIHSNVTTEPDTYAAYQETLKQIGLPLISLLMFIAGFSIGFGPLPWVLNIELFSPEARGRAAAICGCLNWLCSYLVVSSVPALQEMTSAASCYFLFSGVCLSALLFVVFVVPETKGRTDEQLRKYFKGN